MKKCPKCNTIWFYHSDNDYCSGYEAKGFRLNCVCGYAWGAVGWKNSKKDLIAEWESKNRNENCEEA